MNGLHGIIFSYEKRTDLRELTEIRSAASIPFGGRYRAVDFSLSNLVNASKCSVMRVSRSASAPISETNSLAVSRSIWSFWHFLYCLIML